VLYKTHNETDDIDINFSSRKGSISISYNNILNTNEFSTLRQLAGSLKI
jgi:uncharacterized protein YdhG (YjbR/CyaY superfamily)